MPKITPTTITNAASTSQVNANFTAIATELNDKVLYRDNPTGEPNSMQNDLDMNSNDVLNASVIEADSLIVNGTLITAPSPLGTIPASGVTFDNSTSGLTATSVQGAIDEVDLSVDLLANPPATSAELTGAGIGAAAAPSGANVLTVGATHFTRGLTVGPSSVVVPTSGVYTVTFQSSLVYTSGGASTNFIWVRVNGVTIASLGTVDTFVGATTRTITLTKVLNLANGDTVSFHSSNDANTSTISGSISMVRVGNAV